MNNYFQAANTGKAVSWKEWTYKIGDPILFNENKRFSLLYNNLKGRIANIEKESDKITFTVDVDIPLTEMACERDGLTFIEALDGRTRISFDVFSYSDDQIEADESLRLLSVIPFQLAYAVSIHKAQGLEYDSVKVVIPGNTAEKITHGIFYTAITRAKQDLKIFWSSETMQAVVKAFSEEDARKNSLDIIRRKLGG